MIRGVIALVLVAGLKCAALLEGVASAGCTPSIGEECWHVHLLQHSLVLDHGSGGVKSEVLHILPHEVDGQDATVTTTLPPTGLTMNAVGDLKAFLSSTFTILAGVLVLGIAFCVLRLRYPVIYSNNVLEGWAPVVPLETFLGWFEPTVSLPIGEVAESVTLDAAMLLEFSRLCMRILAIVGIPMLCLVGPMNWRYGENRAGKDHLSYLSFGNVVNGSWLYWFHAFIVLGVVMAVTHNLHLAMRGFLPRRFKWLRELSDIRANTVLLESIPEEYQSEKALERYMQRILPGARIESVYLCKDTEDLRGLIQLYERAGHNLAVAEAEWARADQAPRHRPILADPHIDTKHHDAISFWRHQQELLMVHINDERETIQKENLIEDWACTSTGFVTFSQRSSAEIVLRLHGQIASDMDLWQMENAPEPADVLWQQLTQDHAMRDARTVVGHILIAVLFLLYMPIVIGVTNVAKHIDLGSIGLGVLQPFWAGLAPTMGLQLVVAFLPTFLSLIFWNFFAVKSLALLQHMIQEWYFWFQVVFVLVATAVGQNFRQFVATLVQEPLSTFGVLAETMPYATHFYMNFLVLQWLSHFMSFTRYAPLVKYKGACTIYDEPQAKRMAEPEDQDYDGIGGRSARWVTTLSIGIVFGTLCPPINLLCFVNFAICRVVYGYLMCFAETKKADLGGVYFVTKLRHVFVSCIIYAILMIGVLLHRAENYGPAIIATPSLAWVIVSKAMFEKYNWEKLPIQELASQGRIPTKRPDKGRYVQPELCEPDFGKG